VKLGGKMVAFAGFWMPVEFSGIVSEHQSVRQAVGLFDVSHMGEIAVRGAGALKWLYWVTTNDLAKLALFQGQYTTILNDRGGVIDDLIIYRRPDDYLLVPNASNKDRVLGWLTSHVRPGVAVEDLSAATGQIAVQGPLAADLVASIGDDSLREIAYFHSGNFTLAGVPCLVSRTGYTGEDGFEIYCEAARTGKIWDSLMAAKPEPRPCGLGARDTLRLEMAYRLHGADMDETTTPLEAGLGWVVKMDKGDFIGKAALRNQMERGVRGLLAIASVRHSTGSCGGCLGGRGQGSQA